ncbi:MAG: hypothetical protein M1482_04110, partial [Chloroflexi bacterium]|nr:hypothetical protein [Chloroflexota bacterium]
KIQNEYRLSYVTPNPLHNGVKRDISVTATGAAAASAAYNPGGVIPEVAPQWSAWLLFLVALVVLLGLFFAPLGLRLARERGVPIPRLAPQPARASRVRLIGPSQAAGEGPTPARPSRIKIRNAPAATGTAQSQMPWDEGAPRH